MKKSKQLRIVAACMTIVGVILLILAFTILKTCDNCGQGWEGHRAAFGESYSPNFFLLVLGGALTMFSLALWFMSFSPQITKMSVQLHSETLDVAGKDIQEMASKSIDLAEPIMAKGVDVTEPYVKRVTKTKAAAVKEAFDGDVKEELKKLQDLYNEGLITSEEYEELRKKKLGL